MLYIASDHAGFLRKQKIIEYLNKKGVECTDLGTDSTKSTDFHIYAKLWVKKVLEDKENKGI